MNMNWAGPHLVLAHACHDHRIVAVLDDLVQLAQHVLGRDDVDIRDVDAGMAVFEVPQTVEPYAAGVALHQGEERVQRQLHVAGQADGGAHVLVDLRRLDVEVNDVGVRAESARPADHPVVESHADAEDKVRLGGCDVAPVHAVHAQHPVAQLVVARERGRAVQRVEHWRVQLLGERLQFVPR